MSDQNPWQQGTPGPQPNDPYANQYPQGSANDPYASQYPQSSPSADPNAGAAPADPYASQYPQSSPSADPALGAYQQPAGDPYAGYQAQGTDPYAGYAEQGYDPYAQGQQGYDPSQYGYGAAPVMNAGAAKAQGANFFKALFDFSFSKFVTPQIVAVVYAVACVLIGLSVLFGVIAPFVAGQPGIGVLWLVLGPVIGLVSIAMVRVGLEGTVALVRTAENTKAIADKE